MPDHEMTMRRTESGLLIPDHVISNKPDEQLEKPAEPEKPKSTPGSVLKLNRALRRRLGKPWQGRKMKRDLARAMAADQLKNGGLPVVRKVRKQRGCAEDCGCRLRHPGAGGAGGASA